MKTLHCLVAAALAFAAPFPIVQAQPAAPATAASAAPLPRLKTAPRLLTPTEARSSATAPGELRPEEPVIPQISIPLGRTPPVTESARKHPVRRDKTGNPGIDDSAARCRAQAGSQARAACAEKAR